MSLQKLKSRRLAFNSLINDGFSWLKVVSNKGNRGNWIMESLVFDFNDLSSKVDPPNLQNLNSLNSGSIFYLV